MNKNEQRAADRLAAEKLAAEQAGSANAESTPPAVDSPDAGAAPAGAAAAPADGAVAPAAGLAAGTDEFSNALGEPPAPPAAPAAPEVKAGQVALKPVHGHNIYDPAQCILFKTDEYTVTDLTPWVQRQIDERILAAE